jgi:hypothetical protein
MAKVAKIKTTENESNVNDFINSIVNEGKRNDSIVLMNLMEIAANETPKMWGNSMIGFGNLRYKSPSGREVDWFRIGFAPRKANLSLYLMGLDGARREVLLKKLGKYKTDGGCIYINKLEDVDMKVLAELINAGVKEK